MSTPTEAGTAPAPNRRAARGPMIGAYPLLMTLLAVSLGVSGQR